MAKPKLKIKKGDSVVVLTGRNKGAKGEVLKVFPNERRVIVQGVNVVTRHKKPTQVSPGGISKEEKSIHISNIAIADPKTGEATRVGYKTLKDGKKVRVAKKSGEEIGSSLAATKEKAKKPAAKKETKAKEEKPKKEAAKKAAPKKETKAKEEKPKTKAKKDTAKKEK